MSWRLDAGVRRFGWVVLRTSAANVAAAAAAGLAGIVIARALGAEGRGSYAAIMAWFGVILVVGQLGQTAATTYFVAGERLRAAAYLATSRNLMVASGVVTLAVGFLLAPVFGSATGAPTAGYRLMFATCLACFVGASYVFSLQATDLPRWNLVRVSQPVAYLAIIPVLHIAGWLDVLTALLAASATMLGQSVLAYWLCRSRGLTGGRAERALARPLVRFGLGHMASLVPQLITNRLAVLVLSVAVAPAALGQYAVAVSLTALAAPVVAAIGNVSFPRIAARTLSTANQARLQRWAVLTSVVVGTGLMLPLAATASWLVPAVFGAEFGEAARLVVLLAPSGVLLGCVQVCANLLRGYGRPMAVAGAQSVAAVATVVLLAVLVPAYGVVGAAVTTNAGAAVALVFLLWALARHRPPAEPAPVAVGAPGTAEARNTVV